MTNRQAQLEHEVDVQIASCAENGCLSKLVSVIHARGLAVTDMHYSTLIDGSKRLSARFRGSGVQATTLRHSLRRVVHVTNVSMTVATARMPDSERGEPPA